MMKKQSKTKNRFFDPVNGGIFFEKHPILKLLYTVVEILVVIIPTQAYTILACSYFSKDSDSYLSAVIKSKGIVGAIVLFIGVLGSVGIAAGLWNIWMAVKKEYLGHLFTLIALGGGVMICTLSLLILSGAF